MADIQRTGDQLIGNEALQLVYGRGGSERTDPQRVEKIGDESDDKFNGRRPTHGGAAPRRTDPADDEGHASEADGHIEGKLRSVHPDNIPGDGAEMPGSPWQSGGMGVRRWAWVPARAWVCGSHAR